MAETTKIEWADYTFNHVVWWPHGPPRVASESYWNAPVKWNKDAAEVIRRWVESHKGKMACDEPPPERPRVFCASLADVFEDWVGPMVASNGVQVWKRTDHGGEWTTSDHYRDTVMLTMADVRARLFRLIEATPHLDWLLLTKRPENILRMMDGAFKTDDTDTRNPKAVPLPNVWLGTTVEDQKAADLRIPHLLKVPARVRFLSCEPLLGPVKLTDVSGWADTAHWWGRTILGGPGGIHWVIAGGESGPGARPSHPDWFRSIRDQCVAAGVAFHFKQHGEWAPDADDGTHWFESREDGEFFPLGKDSFAMEPGELMRKVGKKAAGRLLDGREWNEVPS